MNHNHNHNPTNIYIYIYIKQTFALTITITVTMTITVISTINHSHDDNNQIITITITPTIIIDKKKLKKEEIIEKLIIQSKGRQMFSNQSKHDILLKYTKKLLGKCVRLNFQLRFLFDRIMTLFFMNTEYNQQNLSTLLLFQYKNINLNDDGKFT